MYHIYYYWLPVLFNLGRSNCTHFFSNFVLSICIKNISTNKLRPRKTGHTRRPRNYFQDKRSIICEIYVLKTHTYKEIKSLLLFFEKPSSQATIRTQCGSRDGEDQKKIIIQCVVVHEWDRIIYIHSQMRSTS